jgi:hypothetical protein
MSAVRRRSDALAFAAATVALVLISLPVSSHSVPGPERSVFRVLNTDAVPYSIVWLVMQLGDFGIFPIAAGVATLFRRWRLACSLALAGAAAYLCPLLVKEIVRRGRPATLLPGVLQRGAHEGGLGYVSGHAALVTALFVVAWALGLDRDGHGCLPWPPPAGGPDDQVAPSGSSGTMIHIARYSSSPEPPSTASRTNSTRIRVASTLKYCATPPHTPASMRLLRLRYSLRVRSMAPPFASGGCNPQAERDREPSRCRALSPPEARSCGTAGAGPAAGMA